MLKPLKQLILIAFSLSITMTTGLNTLSHSAEEIANAASAPQGEKIAAINTSAVASSIPKMSIKQNFETDDASLYIDLVEVLRLRGTASGIPPVDRIKIVQERLERFLKNGGNARDIKPGQEDASIVVRAGNMVLITVDAATAEKNKMTQKQQALHWTNQIRKALGADPIVRDTAKVASRGLSSPALGHLGNYRSTGAVSRGMASWYGPGFHGRRCANGERFNMNSLTAAHRTLPFNTQVRVTNARTGRSAIVRITDRGPYSHGRIIDLSKGAASAIGMLSSGTAPVVLEVVGR